MVAVSLLDAALDECPFRSGRGRLFVFCFAIERGLMDTEFASGGSTIEAGSLQRGKDGLLFRISFY